MTEKDIKIQEYKKLKAQREIENGGLERQNEYEMQVKRKAAMSQSNIQAQ